MTRYGMALDINRCIGCQACAAACKIANNLPEELSYNVVYTKNDTDYDSFGTAVAKGSVANDNATGAFPQCHIGYLPVQCQHCANAACVAVCPTGATEKQDDGIVTVNGELCIGCESCVKACPYEGVRTLLSKEPNYLLDVVVGEADAPSHRPATVEKCTFCRNLIERDEEPACMVLCPGRARYWGDLDDAESEVSKALQDREWVVLKESAGTDPSVYYLV